MAAICEIKPSSQEALVIDSQESDDCLPPDDSDDDPTFDIQEETRSGFARMSLKKSRPRISREVESESDDEPECVEVNIPELDKKDAECFEKIEKLIKDGQLEKLKVDQCKVYLRKHGLRLTGKKDILTGRIKEHLEVINGGGEKKYPPSSFVLNCKGDACTGDIVMFEQSVYEMFSIVSRSATALCGTRVVVGRIVKESYGAAKQQHTFTIEVLWSKGEKPLPPLHPLLIKGRNLYKLKTMRQMWADEGERRKILQEKHQRGNTARCERENRIQDREIRKMARARRMENKKENMPSDCRNHRETDTLKKVDARQHTREFEQQIKSCIVQSTEMNIGHQKYNRQTQQHTQELQPQMNSRHVQSKPMNTEHQNYNHQALQPYNYKFQTANSIPRNVKHQYPMSQAHRMQSHPNNYQCQQPRVYSYPLHGRPQSSGLDPRSMRLPQQQRPMMQRQPCCFYRQGRCHFGDNCKYWHD